LWEPQPCETGAVFQSQCIQVEELAEKQPYGTGGSTSFRSEFLSVVLGLGWIVIGGWHENILILWMNSASGAVHLFLVSPLQKCFSWGNTKLYTVWNDRQPTRKINLWLGIPSDFRCTSIPFQCSVFPISIAVCSEVEWWQGLLIFQNPTAAFVQK